MAFEDVCPDRIDLIHKNYRKLCNLLIDIDEWGQVAVIHMLTRYARTQFIDPNKVVRMSTVVIFCRPCKFETAVYSRYLSIEGFYKLDCNFFTSLYQRVSFIQSLNLMMKTMTVMMKQLKRNQRSSLMLWILITGCFCGHVNHSFKAGMLQ